MRKRIGLPCKVLLLCLAMVFTAAAAYAEPQYHYWGDYWKNPLMRTILDDSTIYEYYNEIRVPGPKGGGYGRLILEANPNTPIEGEGFIGYKKWDWDTLASTNQVLIQVYQGSYNPSHDVWSGVQAGDRRVEYIYDYNTSDPDWWQVNTSINGWIERQKTVYDTDGATILRKYLRDSTPTLANPSSGRLIKDIYTADYIDPSDPTFTHLANTYSTYEYFTDAALQDLIHYKREYSFTDGEKSGVLDGSVTGTLEVVNVYESYLNNLSQNQSRVAREIHKVTRFPYVANTYYEYIYHTSPGMEGQARYKRVYTYNPADEAGIIDGTITGTFDSEYELVDTNYMVKREGPLVDGKPTGKTTTLIIDSSRVSHNHTFIDPLSTEPKVKDVLLVYNWDSSWNIIDVTKYYPNGTIEICTPTTAQANGTDTNPDWPLKEKIEPKTGFIKGFNLPWLYKYDGETSWSNYGYAIGMNGASHEGFSRNIKQLYDQMDKCKGGYVRIFLFADFRAGMTFDADGTPTGFTDKVYEDMQALLDCSKALGIKLMPVLFDYMIADGTSTEHADLISDPVKRQALIDIFSAFIATFGNDPSIYAWDIMNEPEYAASATTPDLQDFVEAFAAMIHAQAPGSLVTVGSRNNTDVKLWNGLGLDFYQFHYYDSMGADPLNTSAESLGLDAPVMVGELQGTNIMDKLNALYNNGYFGGFFWQDGTGYTISEADYQLIQDWYEGTKFGFYSSKRISSAIIPFPDEGKKEYDCYYHYIDEDFDHDGDGTIGDNEHYGRVDIQIRITQDGDGAIGYAYDYYAGTKKERLKWLYGAADYSDPSHPVLANEIGAIYTEYYESGNKCIVITLNQKNTTSLCYWDNTIEYWDNSSGLIHRQWVLDKDPTKFGNDVYYEYDVQGRLIAVVSDNGSTKGIQYIGDTKKRFCAHDYDASGNQKTLYVYYNDDANLLEYMVRETPDDFNSTYYHFLNEPFKDNGTPTKPDDDYGRVDKQILAVPDRDGATAYEFEYYGATERYSVKRCYQSGDFANLVVTYRFYDNETNDIFSKDEAGGNYYEYVWDVPAVGKFTLTKYGDNTKAVILGAYIYSYTNKSDSKTWALADSMYYGNEDHLWHKISDFVDIGGGEPQPQIDDAYTGFDTATGIFTGFVYRAEIEYYDSGRRKVKKIYDNTGAVENISYEKYTYNDDAGNTLGEKIFYFDGTSLSGAEIGGPDNMWHKSSNFTGKLGDGRLHAQHDNVYTDSTLSTLAYSADYTYFSNGRIESKTLDRADSSGNNYYEYINEPFYDPGTPSDTSDDYGRIFRQRDASTGRVLKHLDWYAGTDKVKKEEEYTDLSESNWIETRWFYESGRLSKKVSSTGEAAKYFDVAGYKLDTYWSASGTITHWDSEADYDSYNHYKSAWYYDGSTYLEVYTYYASGRVQYKDVYMLSGGQWTWQTAGSYADDGGNVAAGNPWGTWAGWTDRATTGADQYFDMPDKPARADSSVLSLQGGSPLVKGGALNSNQELVLQQQNTEFTAVMAINAAKLDSLYCVEGATMSPQLAGNPLNNGETDYR